MALRTNRLNAQSYMGGIFAGGTELWAVRRIDLLKNLYAGEGGIDDKSGIPNGYNTGATLLPLKPGGMSSFNPAILNLVKLDADAKMGRNLEGSASLTLVVSNAQADQIVSLSGSGSLSIAVDNAGLSAGVQAQASASLSIVGDLGLGGIIPVEASASTSVSPSVTLTALGFLEIDNTPPGLTAQSISDAILDENDIENGYSLREAIRLALASMAGKVSGAGTATITIRNVGDTKDRIVATVDSNGNRTAVTYDVSD